MMRYAQTPRCRVAFLNEYFGDRATGAEAACGRCDNCAHTADSLASAIASPPAP